MKTIIIGIYKITSPTGKIYIGQSVNVKKRWANYKRLVNCNEQLRLYNSFLKHGVENHIFEIIHECKTEELNDCEAYYGKLFNVTNETCGLNIKECGGAYGKHNEETKEKISNSHKGKIKSKEHIKKISESRKKMSDEMRDVYRQSQLGKKMSKESSDKKRKYAKENGIKPPVRYREDLSEQELKKLSERWSGKNNPNYRNKNTTPEHKQKLLDANLGKKRSEESKRKQSEKNTGVPLSDYHKQRISEGNKGVSRGKGRKQTEEHIRNKANAIRGKKRSEEAIRKSIESKKIIRQERLMMVF